MFYSVLLPVLSCYGQERLVSKGIDYNNDEVEYYLQTETVKKVDSHTEATIRKYIPVIDRSILMECKVDCAKHKYMIPKTKVKDRILTWQDAEWSLIVPGSLIEKTFVELCTF